MRILFAKVFAKKFSKYDKPTQKNIHNAILNIPNGDIKAIISKHTPKLYRLRVGKYRIIFHYENTDTVRVLLMGSRGEIYKNLIK